MKLRKRNKALELDSDLKFKGGDYFERLRESVETRNASSTVQTKDVVAPHLYKKGRIKSNVVAIVPVMSKEKKVNIRIQVPRYYMLLSFSGRWKVLGS